MKETKKFKTESKRLLDLMIHSIYTNREIFLRELISNASDAMDKRHYLSLSDEKVKDAIAPEIRIDAKEKDRLLIIEDTGIGMTHDELVQNLGTIARSGSLEFLRKMEEEQKEGTNVDIIGQFGVGFYSAFMVADQVMVETKSPYDEKAYCFTSTGEDSYTIEEIERSEVGTKITLHLRDNLTHEHHDDEDMIQDEENYDIFLRPWKIEELVKKYSDYIRYPIRMEVEVQVQDKDAEGKPIEGKYSKHLEDKTLNSQIPLWKKNKSEVTEEQKNAFYKDKFSDYEDPLSSMFFHVEGLLSYDALLYVPGRVPFDLYSEKYEKGLQLYTKGVFIMDKCKDLIPDYLKFMKGIVDSSDLSLNISREMLQKSAQLNRIAQNLEKKIVNELSKMKDTEIEQYEKFFKLYGTNIKFGIYESYGSRKDLLKDLLLYETLNEEKYVSLKQYKDAMKEDQKAIYFASGKIKDAVRSMPQMDGIMKKGYDVLILSEDIDEFTIMMLHDYEGVEFKNISEANLDLVSQEEKDQIEKLKEEKKDFLTKLKDAMKEEVSDVRFSSRLVDSPVCLVSGEGLSIEMEKVLQQMPNGENAKATRILEINPHHALVDALEGIEDEEEFKEYAQMMYDQALLMEGLPLKNPSAFAKSLSNLMVRAAKKN